MQLRDGAGMITMGQIVELTAPSASVTWMLNEPGVVGVPVTSPVEGLNVRPPGSVPTTEKVYGDVPPVTVGTPLSNRTPTSPLVIEVQFKVGGGATVTEQFKVPVLPALSVMVTV